MISSRIRTLLSAVWLLFTISLVSWWFIFALRHLNADDTSQAAKHYRMLYFEGSTLIVTVLAGGIVMIFLSHKDDQRHQRLKYFFSNFTHDIKTSITRLRLQVDILTEENQFKNHRVLNRLLNDLAKLDLQLENSLLITHVAEALFLEEKINLADLIKSIVVEFEELEIKIEGNANVHADSRSLRSIFRNLLENSRQHGQATEIHIQVSEKSQAMVQISVHDNGCGSTQNNLGHQILSNSGSQGAGIGLFLARQLLRKMNGSIESNVRIEPAGFQSLVNLPGRLI